MAIIRGIDRKREHLAAIGRVTVYHTYLQYEFAKGVQLLLGVSQEHASLLVSQLPFNKSLLVIEAAAKSAVSDEAVVEELMGLIERARAANNVRNTMVHSIWAVPLQLLFEEPAVRLKPKPKEPLESEPTLTSASEIDDIAEQIRGVLDGFAHFWPKLRGSA